MDKRRIGFFSLLFSAFLYGFYGILSRLISFNIPLFYGSFFRNGICTLILLGILIITRQWKPVLQKDFKYILLRSVLGYVGYLGAFIPIIFIPISTFYFNNYAGIVVGGYFMGWFLMKEKIAKIKLISLCIALFGLSLIYTFTFSSSTIIYSLFGFIGGIGTSFWNVITKKISHSYSALQLNFLDFTLFTIIGFIFSLLFQEQWVMPELSSVWLANIGFIFIFLITGQLIVIGFKYLDSQIGSLILLLDLVFGILFAYLFFKESVSLTSLIGGLCIILSILLPELIKEGKALTH